MPSIVLPFHYTPRVYQLPALVDLDNGFTRAVMVWHRRAGKDKTCINFMAKKSQERVGSYYYFLPTNVQGRKIIWDGMDGDGFRFLDHFPEEIREGTNSTEMKIRFKNGSLIQIVGSDNIDSIVGTNPVGCIFSEYAIQDPQGWDFVRPILRENGGWALFPYTPRGKNHGFDLYKMALKNPDWHCSILTIEDTGVMTEKDVQDERDAGMDEALIQQEFYCSFKSPLQGSYYSQQMDTAYDEGRICEVAWNPDLPVDTWWDLGIGDSNVILFSQTVFQEIRFIDYYETSGEGFPFYAKMLQEKPYVYGEHIGPHDLSVRELGTGVSRIETARKLGINFKIAKKLPLDDGISAVRSMLQYCWFDEVKCARLIDACIHYHKEYEPRIKEWKKTPHHDWSSHPVDALRTGAVGRKRAKLPKKIERYQPKKHRQRSWMSA